MTASQQLKILLVTDVFPPGSGGSGWSTFYLGKALSERGHDVKVLRPRYDLPTRRPALRRTQYGGLAVEELVIPSPPAWTQRPGLQRAWQEREGARQLGAARSPDCLARAERSPAWPAQSVDPGSGGGRSACPVSRCPSGRGGNSARLLAPLPCQHAAVHEQERRLVRVQGMPPFLDIHVKRAGRRQDPVPLASTIAGALAGNQASRPPSGRCDAVIAVSRYVAMSLR